MEAVFKIATEVIFLKSAVGSPLPTGWSPELLVAIQDFAPLYSSLFPKTDPTFSSPLVHAALAMRNALLS